MKIFYPPPYQKTVWRYQQVGTELMKRGLEYFDRQNAFLNCNPNESVSVLVKTVLNIMINFIPDETILVDDRDPLWITTKLSKLQETYFKTCFKTYFTKNI